MGIKKGVKVSVRSSNGTLQLTYRYGVDPKRPSQRRRHYKALGLRDTPANRKLAEAIALQLEAAFVSGTQDQFLNSLNQEEETPETPSRGLSLLSIWTQYEEYKRPRLRESTFYISYLKLVRPALERHPDWTIDDPQRILKALRRETSLYLQGRICQRLKACSRWANQEGLIPEDYLKDLQAEQPRRKKRDTRCFTLEERDLIIATFDSHIHFKRYTLLIQFLFLTGCRPSEAAGFHIEQIHLDPKDPFIVFDRSVTTTEQGTKRVTPGLKTENRRRFPVNGQLRRVLELAMGDREEGILFPAPHSDFVDMHHLGTRAWKRCLEIAGIDYLTIYATRHTFITHCLRAKIPVAEVARWVGNSPTAIHGHYAAAIGDLSVPEF